MIIISQQEFPFHRETNMWKNLHFECIILMIIKYLWKSIKTLMNKNKFILSENKLLMKRPSSLRPDGVMNEVYQLNSCLPFTTKI